ncbi:Peptidase U62 [Nitrospira sp. KM1]|uniref:TldD/PmbA family protein n=1 Tax=Nitrospira sp. KM1 TaxID=1936990 RepID=UPI0013A797A2|nr:metallopeptidase TldD-related protein [Nitrospira sp. KM1]BCA57001.1 Peptidase U62 [Nitrospira sp. KM1]
MNDIAPHQRFTDLAADVLAKAKASGATEADVVIADGESLSVQVRLGMVDRLSKAREKRLGLRVFVGKQSACTSTSDFSIDSLSQLVVQTCALAKAVIEDPMSGLPEAAMMAGDPPDLDLFDSTKLDTDRQIELAKRAEEAAMSADERITNSEGADFDSSAGRVVLGNSHGFIGAYRSSSYSLSVSPIASDPATGAMQRDAWYAVQRKFSKLDTPESVGVEAARRTLRRLGARKVGTTRVPVVFDQEMAGSLLGNLCSALSGYSLYKGASFLSGQLGQTIAPEYVTVYDDGRMVGGLGSRPFDGEGLATKKNTIIDRGVLKNYLLDSYSGRKLGLSSTGNASRSVGESPSAGPTNFYMTPGMHNAQEIIGTVKDGLYVTELIGFGINMVTGDYSRGAGGYWIENGELAYPVEEITIAGNLKQMLRDIELVGSDLVFRGRIASPTLKLAEMMVAGS